MLTNKTDRPNYRNKIQKLTTQMIRHVAQAALSMNSCWFSQVEAAGILQISAGIQIHDVSPAWSASVLNIAKDIKETRIQTPSQVMPLSASLGFTRQNDTNHLNWTPDKIPSLQSL